MRLNTKNQRFFLPWEHLLPKSIVTNKNGHLVFGVQKSGTSVIANTLAYCSKESLTLDHASFWPTLRMSSQDKSLYVARLFERHPLSLGSTFIKEPCMTISPEVFKRHRPNKCILVIRDPLDTARSILDRLNVPIESKLLNLDSIPATWHDLFLQTSKNQPPFIRLIEYWCMCMDNTFWHDSDVIRVHYEQFISNPDDIVQLVLNGLELNYKRPASEVIGVQVQPRGKNRNRRVCDLIPPQMLQQAENLSGDIYSRFNASLPKQIIGESL